VTYAQVGPKVPVVLTIDVEPDHPWPPLKARDPWLGFEAWLEYAPRLREHLEKATEGPVHFNWALRMDDQIAGSYGDSGWVALKYGTQLTGMVAEGDELGLHPHAWRWQDPPGRWLQDHASDEFVAAVIGTSFDTYLEAFGTPCRSHRFGSRFISAGIVREIRSRGVRVDTTVEPGARGMVALEKSVVATGWLPDQATAPRAPYQPSSDDPLTPAPVSAGTGIGDAADDGDALWMLPATAFDPAPSLPAWRRQVRRVRFMGKPLHRPAELWSPMDPSLFWSLAAESSDVLAAPYVSLAVRSDCLIRPDLADRVTAKLEGLAREPGVGRMRFMAATEAIDELTGTR
jgi:hypothetical protein